MSTSTVTERRRLLLTGTAFLVLLAAGLWWAKYGPYSSKVPGVVGGSGLGDSIVTGGEEAAPAVSLAAGWEFTVVYTQAVWKALVVGLVLAAAVQVLLPATWLQRVLGGRGGWRGAAASVPTLMCSCCAAPLAVGLRRARASVTSVLAFWLGNPALNPVVLVFCLAVLPWPWTLLRLAAGVAVVAAGIGVARWAERRGDTADAAETPAVLPEPDTRPVPVRFVATLAGMSVRLLPEYLVVVLALGALRGVLFPLDAGVLGLLLLLLGALALPVPTGGEVAVVAAALAAGLPAPAAAVLLVALPVLSLPSLLMVRRVFPGRVLGGTTAAVAGVALLAAGGTALLTG